MTALLRQRRSWTRAACRLMLGMLALGSPLSALGADIEDSIKATYLYKFLGYVDWPAGTFAAPDTPQVIAVLRADEVLAELQVLAGVRNAQLGNRRLVVRRLTADEPLDGVHVLHIGRGAHPVEPIAWSRLPVLVVTDNPAGISEHAALNFVTIDRRVRFEAAPATAERAGLKLSARLLAVAERVVPP